MGEVLTFRQREYDAKAFTAAGFQISGTLCGHIDVATPDAGTYCLSPDEVQELIVALTNSRADVLANSRPFDDPRLYSGEG